MLSQEQFKEIREHLEKSQNPLFFFDNDPDGLCSFLILCRFLERGKGIAIKSFPDLSQQYCRRLHELSPDYIFVLDKPLISDEFIAEARSLGLPFVWIDHHDLDPQNLEGISYFNPIKGKEKTSEPVTYLSYLSCKKKEDLWLALAGCISDNFLPDFTEDFAKQYPDLWADNIKTAFDALYKTRIGEITRILSFSLKDRTSNVVRMVRFLLKVRNPWEILEDSSRNPLMFRFNQVNRRYQKLLEKAQSFPQKEKLLYFQYGGELSLSADISNELSYLNPGKVIIVAYIQGTKANISIRGKNIKDITLKAIEGLEGATGGGHKDATGCKIMIEDLPKFKEKIEKLVKERS